MGSDRARTSYDAKKQYRRVVHQQGRVILDADLNEAQTILTEEARHEAFDFVGPVGVPSPQPLGGVVPFSIAPAASGKAYDFAVSAGVIYVAGVRVALDAATDFSKQPDDVLHRALPEKDPGRELVFLELEEREISALEDHVLREVALGGPDSAQRLRVVRRIRRLAVTDSGCASALDEAKKHWHSRGMAYFEATSTLRAQSALKADFVPQAAPPDLCEPAALGGYLGDENQLVRVQLFWASDAPKEKKLLWAYDAGSALYRATLDPAKDTLVLSTTPVDAHHRPRAGQYAEVLRPELHLGPGASPEDKDDYGAAAVGVVRRIQADYQDDGTLKLASGEAFPTGYTGDVFVRIWENQHDLVIGSPVELVEHGGQGLGVTVTVSLDSGAELTRGDFWTIGVRPGAPDQIDPPRLREAPQRPDGPRRWAVPLGVVSWNGAGALAGAVTPCSPAFDNLVELTKRVDALYADKGACCACTFELGPKEVNGDLQGAIEHRLALAKSSKITICLARGHYALRTPLRLIDEADETKPKKYSGLTIQGSQPGVVLSVADGADAAFNDGMFVLADTEDITLEGIELKLPHAVSTQKVTGPGGDTVTLHAVSSIGVQALRVRNLTLRDCVFQHVALPAGARVERLFGPCVLGRGALHGLSLERSTFSAPTASAAALFYGYLHSASTHTSDGKHDVLDPTLDDAVIRDNRFRGFGVGVLVSADAGYVRIESNVMRDVHSGIWIEGSAYLPSGGTVAKRETGDSVVSDGLTLARGYPRPKGVSAIKAAPAADASPAKPAAPAPVAKRARAVEMKLTNSAPYQPFEAQLVGAEAEARAVAQPSRMDLHVTGNDVGAPGGSSLGDGPALFVAVRSDDDDSKSSAIVSANRLRMDSGRDTCMVVANVRHVAITGNLVLNGAGASKKDDKPVSLAAIGERVELAVTGNLLHGAHDLPARKLAPPLDDWMALNTKI